MRPHLRWAVSCVFAVPLLLLLAGCDRGGRGPSAGAVAEPAGPGAVAEPARSEPDEPVAFVDGVPIGRGQLERRVRQAAGGDPAAAADLQLRAGILEQLIEERVLLAEAARRGLSVPQSEVEAAARAAEATMGADALERELAADGLTPAAWRAQLAETLLIHSLLVMASRPKPITEHDVRVYYREHRDDFVRPAESRVRILTLATRVEAEKARAQLLAGADFAALARERSISPEREAGGDLGFVPKGQLPPEFDAVIASLEPGEVSAVVESPYGFHIFRLEERRAARKLSLDEARDEILQLLTRMRAEEAHERWLADLRAKAKIEIVDPELRNATAKVE